MYAMICTQSTILYAISIANQYIYAPGKKYWQAVKWIMRYIYGMIDIGLKFIRDDNIGLHLVGYLDSDYTCDLDKHRSTTTYAFTLGRAPVCWLSTLQAIIALSMTEAEYIVLTEVIKLAI